LTNAPATFQKDTDIYNHKSCNDRTNDALAQLAIESKPDFSAAAREHDLGPVWLRQFDQIIIVQIVIEIAEPNQIIKSHNLDYIPNNLPYREKETPLDFSMSHIA
jgi:hypothetical protein